MAEPSPIAADGEEAQLVPARHGRVLIRRQIANLANATVRVLRPETANLDPIAWLAPSDEAREALQKELYLELYEDLHFDLREDLRDEVRDEVRFDLRTDLLGEIDGLRVDLSDEIDGLRADLSDEIDGLRADLSDEIDGLRDDVLDIEAEIAPVTEQTGPRSPRSHRETALVWAQRAGGMLAAVLSLALIGAVTLAWQRTETVPPKVAPRVTVAPPDVTGVLARVDRLDQQLAGLLAVSANPAAPSDVTPQIGAVQADLSGIRGCLQAFKRAVAAGERAVSAIGYC